MTEIPIEQVRAELKEAGITGISFKEAGVLLGKIARLTDQLAAAAYRANKAETACRYVLQDVKAVGKFRVTATTIEACRDAAARSKP